MQPRNAHGDEDLKFGIVRLQAHRFTALQTHRTAVLPMTVLPAMRFYQINQVVKNNRYGDLNLSDVSNYRESI